MSYLAARMPAVGIAIRLGFSGSSPWRDKKRPPAGDGKTASYPQGQPPQRERSVIPALLLALCIYGVLSAIRTVDTFIAATVRHPITWNTTTTPANRTFDLLALAGVPAQWTVSPTMVATIYDGFQPPFDSTGKEWFARAATVADRVRTPQSPLNLTDVLVLNNTLIAGYKFVSDINIRDLSVTDRHKTDAAVLVGFGYKTKANIYYAYTDAARPLFIPVDLQPGNRAYGLVHVAPVTASENAFMNLSLLVVNVSYTAVEALPSTTDISKSLCIQRSGSRVFNQLAVVTQDVADFGSYTLTINPAALVANETVWQLLSSTCSGTLGSKVAAFSAAAVTLRAKVTASYVFGPLRLTGGTVPDHLTLDADAWLAGPATGGAYDYVEYSGNLVDAPFPILGALGGVLVVALAVVLWPRVVCENLVYAGAGDERAGMEAGWTWAALRNRYGHAAVPRPVAAQWGQGPGVSGYVLKTVAAADGETLTKVVAQAKREGIDL
ncbi:hypothetical protein DFJ73DRAFT_783305 [Zopfochytrium polystomum]|nr:hypothetical protein DFJ73DRAFT_783305 [Zopfochytrium polystomum]